MFHGDDGGHVEGVSDAGPAAECGAFSAEGARVAVDGGDADGCGDPLTASRSNT